MDAPLGFQRTTHYEVHLVWDDERACYALEVFLRSGSIVASQLGDFQEFYPLGGPRFPGFCQASVPEMKRWLRSLQADVDVEMVTGMTTPFYLEDKGPGPARDYWVMRRKGRHFSGRRDGQIETIPPPSLFAVPNPIGAVPLGLKVALGIAGAFGVAALANTLLRAKVASAITSAVPGSTVNPTPPTSIAITPSSKHEVQLATKATGYDLLPSVDLVYDTSASLTTVPATGVVQITETSTGAHVTAVAPGPALITISYGDPTGKTDAFVSVGVVA
jgi:hypothetical protein